MLSSIAFICDPLNTFQLYKDSTYALMLEAKKRGYRLAYIPPQNIFLRQNKVLASLYWLDIQYECPPGDKGKTIEKQHSENSWYRLSKAETMELSTLEHVFLRKDPPFDQNYLYLTYYLDLAVSNGAKVYNNPTQVRDCNEKLTALRFEEFIPPTLVSQSVDILHEFILEHHDTVLKPLNLMGGQGIFRCRTDDTNNHSVIETMTQNGRTPVMMQRFIPDIQQGDKRILMFNGVPVNYALARIPSADENRGNLAAGGRGVAMPLTPKEHQIAKQVGLWLKTTQLNLVGLDIIGGYLTEVNVTCPTCLRELDYQCDLNLAGDLFDALSL